MNNEPITGALPSVTTLNALDDMAFVLPLTSLGLWIDAVLAISFQSNLLHLHFVWADGIPVGPILLILTGYGLCQTIGLPFVTTWIHRAWWALEDRAKRVLPNKWKKAPWYPDSDRHVMAAELEVEAAFAGNAVLAAYARRRMEFAIAEWRDRRQFLFIGMLLIVELFAPASTICQLGQRGSGFQRAALWLVSISVAVGSLIRGMNPGSLWDTYVSRAKGHPKP